MSWKWSLPLSTLIMACGISSWFVLNPIISFDTGIEALNQFLSFYFFVGVWLVRISPITALGILLTTKRRG